MPNYKKNMKYITDKWRQQGAILAFTALLLPMIIVGTGLAVDLGNIYVQYSRLQNAADAAVAAGAHEYQIRGESPESHKQADTKAAQYIQGEYKNLEAKENVEKKYLAALKDSTIYYKVILTEEVPLYFLKFVQPTFPVTVESIASFQGGKDYSFKNLFIFKNGFWANNTVNNVGELNDDNIFNDPNRCKNMLSDTFDGNVSTTKGNGSYDPDYKPKYGIHPSKTGEEGYLHPLKNLYTSYAKEDNKNKSIRFIMPDGGGQKAIFDENTGKLQGGYWIDINPIRYNFSDFRDYMKKKCEVDKGSIYDQNLSSERYLSQKDIIYVSLTGVVTINVDKTLGENWNDFSKKDEPIYIYIVPGKDIRKIELQKDTGRPLIVCIDGEEGQDRDVHFELRGHTFRGVVYAPYSTVRINGENSCFRGTIVASNLEVKNDHCSYIYEDFTGGNGGSASSGANINGISLTNSPGGNINWQ